MKLLRIISSVLESLGKARAATHLARIGQYESARHLMTEK
jgi:hypothetical protein